LKFYLKQNDRHVEKSFKTVQDFVLLPRRLQLPVNTLVKAELYSSSITKDINALQVPLAGIYQQRVS